MRKIKELWEQAKDYKRIMITILVLGGIFIVAKNTVFTETASSAEKIRYLILGGVMETLCVAPETNIFLTEEEGLVAIIAGSKFDVNHLWRPRLDEGAKDRYVAVIVRQGMAKEVLPIKKGLRDGYSRRNREACLAYSKTSFEPVNIVVAN